MKMQILIVALLVVVLAWLVVLWRSLRSQRRRANHLHDKVDQVLASQEGERAQNLQQGNEIRHQNSRLMERMQSILLWFGNSKKNRDQDPQP